MCILIDEFIYGNTLEKLKFSVTRAGTITTNITYHTGHFNTSGKPLTVTESHKASNIARREFRKQKYERAKGWMSQHVFESRIWQEQCVVGKTGLITEEPGLKNVIIFWGEGGKECYKL